MIEATYIVTIRNPGKERALGAGELAILVETRVREYARRRAVAEREDGATAAAGVEVTVEGA